MGFWVHPPPPKLFHYFFSNPFPEEATADAGSQGVLQGGGGMRGSPSVQISSQSCFQKLSSTGPRRPHASEGAGGEEEKGGSPIHFSKYLFFPKTPSMGLFGSRLPGVLEEGGEGGAHPPPKKSPQKYLSNRLCPKGSMRLQAARRMLEGGWRSLPQKIVSPIFFSKRFPRKNSPRIFF